MYTCELNKLYISICKIYCVCMHAQPLQSYLTLCSPLDCSSPGSSVHRILQTRLWSRLPSPPPGDLPHPGIEPMSPESPALQSDSLPLSHWGRNLLYVSFIPIKLVKKNKPTMKQMRSNRRSRRQIMSSLVSPIEEFELNSKCGKEAGFQQLLWVLS